MKGPPASLPSTASLCGLTFGAQGSWPACIVNDDQASFYLSFTTFSYFLSMCRFALTPDQPHGWQFHPSCTRSLYFHDRVLSPILQALLLSQSGFLTRCAVARCRRLDLVVFAAPRPKVRGGLLAAEVGGNADSRASRLAAGSRPGLCAPPALCAQPKPSHCQASLQPLTVCIRPHKFRLSTHSRTSCCLIT